MPRPKVLLARTLIFVHRWLGVALSLVFLLWFLSGIVLMYRTFPEVTAADRLERAPVLNPARITLSAEAAWAAAGGAGAPEGVTLASFDGRPVYRFDLNRGTTVVYADDGTEQIAVDDAMVDRAAAAWARRPVDNARKELVTEVEQWTVAGRLRAIRPLYKYSWPDGQQVYVNGHTAEVVQYTTTASRIWAYLGAIPHWLYFTPLRTHQPQWSSTVVWSSLVGTITALIGIAIILWMYSPRKVYRNAGAPTSIPYRGWKRWHAIAGLSFGLVTVTWTFSGLLSMGPFPLMNRLAEWTTPEDTQTGHGGSAIAEAFRSEEPSLPAFAGRTPVAAISALSNFEVKELEWTSFASEPVYLAANGRAETRIIPVDGAPKSAFDTDAVMRMVRGAAGSALAELRVLDSYDAYYLDRRRRLPLPVVYARLNDPLGSRYYIDANTGRVVGSYNARNWVERWLYHGLHSLEFPWLYNHRPLWDIVVITLMLGGTALCVTSIALTWRLLTRKLAPLARARLNESSDDLTAGG